MTWHVWFAFVAASALMGVIPGPGVTSIVGYALGSGRRTALASVGGMVVGNAVAITLSLAGVGTLLAASALAFSILKWAGALYLVGLGLLTLLKASKRLDSSAAAERAVAPRTAFFGNVAVGTFHPKTIVFFVAFVPQFISPHLSYPIQATLLGFTFCAVVATTDTAYALAASRASGLLRRPGASLWSKRASGGVLVVAGLATAAAKR